MDRRRSTPSEAFADRGEQAPEPTAPGLTASAGQEAELSRLDTRALACVAIAVLLVWATPPAFIGFGMGPPGDALAAWHLVYVLAIVVALVCAGAGAVVAWQSLRIRPLVADDADTAAAHVADAVQDKRTSTTRATGLLVTALVVLVAGNGIGVALGVVTGDGPF